MENSIQNQNDITPGDRFKQGRYTMIRNIGKGGQGSVFLVKDNTDNVELV